MMLMTGLECSGGVPGALPELLQWATTCAAPADAQGPIVDDDELFDLIADLEMVGRQTITSKSLQSMFEQWPFDLHFSISQEWWATCITVTCQGSLEADRTVAAICYGNSEGFANHVVAFVLRQNVWWKIGDGIITFIGTTIPEEVEFSRVHFKDLVLAEPARAEPARAEPARAEPARAEPHAQSPHAQSTHAQSAPEAVLFIYESNGPAIRRSEMPPCGEMRFS